MIAVESKFLNPSLLFGNTAIERFEKKKIPKSFGNIFGFLDHLPRNKSKALRWCSTGLQSEMGQSCCYLLSKRFFLCWPSVSWSRFSVKLFTGFFKPSPRPLKTKKKYKMKNTETKRKTKKKRAPSKRRSESSWSCVRVKLHVKKCYNLSHFVEVNKKPFEMR